MQSMPNLTWRTRWSPASRRDTASRWGPSDRSLGRSGCGAGGLPEQICKVTYFGHILYGRIFGYRAISFSLLGCLSKKINHWHGALHKVLGRALSKLLQNFVYSSIYHLFTHLTSSFGVNDVLNWGPGLSVLAITMFLVMYLNGLIGFRLVALWSSRFPKLLNLFEYRDSILCMGCLHTAYSGTNQKCIMLILKNLISPDD